MTRHRTTMILILSLAALFLATLFTQPLLQAQTSSATGEGMTTDPNRVGQNYSGSFSLTTSLDETSAESSGVDSFDSTSTAQTFTALPGGIDHMAAGVGTRNTGRGTIRIHGIPTGSVIVRAFLYWGTIYSGTPPTTAGACFKGISVTGNRVGVTGEPCWLVANGQFAAYRADVKSLMPSNLNADYSVGCLASSVTNGTNPYICRLPFTPPTAPVSEGASLVVIYSHSSLPTTGRTYVSHGAQLVTGQVDITHTLSPSVPVHTRMRHTRIGADGQVGCGMFSQGTPTGEQTFIGPDVNNLVQIKGAASLLNTDSDWNGHDGEPMNQLWDTHTNAFEQGKHLGIPIPVLPAGTTQYTVRYGAVNDCFIPVVHVLTTR